MSIKASSRVFIPSPSLSLVSCSYMHSLPGVQGYPDGGALLQHWRVHVQPVHEPVVGVLPFLEAHRLSVQHHAPGLPAGARHGHQVEAPAIHGVWEIHLAVFVVWVEIVFPGPKTKRVELDSNGSVTKFTLDLGCHAHLAVPVASVNVCAFCSNCQSCS